MRKRSAEAKILAIFFAVCVLALLITGDLFYAHADPFTCEDAANTCTYRVTATEPTKTVAGAPLSNYKQTNIKTSVNGGAWATLVKPATTPAGGGTVIQDITFATVPCATTTLAVKVSGTNLVGGESVEQAAVGSPVTVDRTTDPTCAPAAPGARVE